MGWVGYCMYVCMYVWYGVMCVSVLCCVKAISVVDCVYVFSSAAYCCPAASQRPLTKLMQLCLPAAVSTLFYVSLCLFCVCLSLYLPLNNSLHPLSPPTRFPLSPSRISFTICCAAITGRFLFCAILYNQSVASSFVSLFHALSS